METKSKEQLRNDQHYFELGKMHQKSEDRNKPRIFYCVLFFYLGFILAIILRNNGLI